MSIHVKNGTPLYGASLCETCAYAHIAKGYRESELVVVCQSTYPERRVTFRVRECTRYMEVKRQSLKQMEDMAWILAGKGSKRQAGFVPPHEVPDEEREIELILSGE